MSLFTYNTNSLPVNVCLCMVTALGAYRGWTMGIYNQTLGDNYKPKHLRRKPLYLLNICPTVCIAGFYGILPPVALFFEAVALEDKLRNGENK